jgi:hypothetical protein
MLAASWNGTNDVQQRRTQMPTQTPNITIAQITAVLQAMIAVAVAFGLSITSEQQTAILGLSAVIGLALTLGDAHIRHGRALAVGQIKAAQSGPAGPVVVTPNEAPVRLDGIAH